ncbi:hypothetical protein POM88_032682 [Heracleum sosnowskyi]|uniref:Protein kinase domain-containing protein n=1 Tax=Heracleum sosnowskyi TaxID=360622 RepID=A0AAD8ML36_9APIA|nr:hypothetical protein POM88_032682 [Heracleum sosnowskyi]
MQYIDRFGSYDENCQLKAIDSGLSDYVKPDERLNGIVGSAYYVAPEVLHRSLWGVNTMLLQKFCINLFGLGQSLGSLELCLKLIPALMNPRGLLCILISGLCESSQNGSQVLYIRNFGMSLYFRLLPLLLV